LATPQSGCFFRPRFANGDGDFGIRGAAVDKPSAFELHEIFNEAYAGSKLFACELRIFSVFAAV